MAEIPNKRLVDHARLWWAQQGVTMEETGEIAELQYLTWVEHAFGTFDKGIAYDDTQK